MAFYTGQKVVCVDTSNAFGVGNGWAPGEAIHQGAIYTVRRYFIDRDGDPIVWLDEVARTEASRIAWRNPDLGYHAGRFRPAVEPKTDISIFERMLDRQPVLA